MKQIIKEALREKVLVRFKEFLENKFSGETLEINWIGDHIFYQIVSIGINGDSEWDTRINVDVVVSPKSEIDILEFGKISVSDYLKNYKRSYVSTLLEQDIQDRFKGLAEHFNIFYFDLDIVFTVE